MSHLDLPGLRQHLASLASASERTQLPELLDAMRRHALEADRIADIPAAFWREINVEKYNKATVPPAYSGETGAGSALRRVLASEEFGAADPGLAFSLPGPSLSGPPISYLATEAQRVELFGRFIGQSEPRWGAFAITEPGVGSDATALTTLARPTADGYVLDGEKCFIGNAARADYTIVMATVAPDRGRFGIKAFWVDRGTPGFEVTEILPTLGVRALQICRITLKDCFVPKDRLLGHDPEPGQRKDTFSAAQGAWDYMRPLLSSVAVGLTRRIGEYTQAWLEDVEGRPALRVPSARVHDSLARMAHRAAVGRALCQRAAWNHDHGMVVTKEAAMAKAYAADAAMESAAALIRLLGPSAPDHPLADKWLRDARAIDLMEGTRDMQRMVIGRMHQSGIGNLGRLLRSVSQVTQKQKASA